ncbi:MAG: histidinol-phosphate transaminase [Proteobacteria bacterium]|nr:histidinol-phosphate transaminase [Pseudomonadota bacterium]NOG61392.1 histidinol-phosphate transaminase [Pseudomonadota bacterium]
MIEDQIKNIIKPAVLEARAYHVPDSNDLVKLDAMENPYVWPDEIKTAWSDYMKQAELNRYPDASTSELREKIAATLSLPDGTAMMFGNGSDELIQIILLALNNNSNVVMAPEPGFVMYRLLSTLLELDYVGVPINEDFSLNLPLMLEKIKEKQPAVIFIAWPNNPTGNMFDQESIETIIKAAPGLVVIDEAYHVFAQKSMMSYVQKYSNVLLMRTLSKLGLAGLRLGILFGAPEWISELEKLRLPYNIGTLNQLSANFIIQNISLLEQQAEQIRSDRSFVFETLSNIDGVEAWPSEANFILFKVTHKDANDVHGELLKNKILIKNLHGAHPLLDNCLRVTIGTREENELFLSALKEIMGI